MTLIWVTVTHCQSVTSHQRYVTVWTVLCGQTETVEAVLPLLWFQLSCYRPDSSSLGYLHRSSVHKLKSADELLADTAPADSCHRSLSCTRSDNSQYESHSSSWARCWLLMLPIVGRWVTKVDGASLIDCRGGRRMKYREKASYRKFAADFWRREHLTPTLAWTSTNQNHGKSCLPRPLKFL